MGSTHDGLTVMDVKGLLDDATRSLTAAVWRVGVKDDATVTAAKPMHFYWEAEGLDESLYWVYRRNDVGWVFVEPSKDHAAEQGGTQTLYASADGANSEFSFKDFAEAIVVILPKLVGAISTNPPAQATLKHDRLMLFFLRPSGSAENWTATAKLFKVPNVKASKEIVGQLNRAHASYISALDAKPSPTVMRADPPSPDQPDQSGLQATLWSVIVACLAVVVGAAALAHGLGRIAGIAAGAVAGLSTVVWMLRIRCRSRQLEPTAGKSSVS
jgi:hypothetical protein